MKQLLIQIKNKIKPKTLINAGIFILIAGLTLSVVFKNNNPSEIMDNLKNANKWFILIALLCMFLYIMGEALNIYRILKNFKDKTTLSKCFKYSLVGFFFSSITPSSTGGQPMQVYFMNKDKVPIAHGTLALLVQLLSFQFVTLLLAVVGFFLNRDILLHHIGNIKYLMLFGITVNIVIEVFLFIMIFSKKMGEKIMDFVYKMLKKFKYKKSESFKEKSDAQLKEYHECANYLNKHKALLVKTILTTIVQLSVYHCVPYFIYRSFGLSNYNAFNFIFMEAVLYISVASLPFPGAMGISEGSFMIMFKMFFPAAILGSAMIISRTVNFYLFIIICLMLIGAYVLYDKIREKNFLNKQVKTN